MSTNFTGGARNAHKRFSTRTSQDITGTPVYQQVRRGAARSGGQIYSSRRNDHHQSGAKRRKTGHGLGNEPEFQFAHARRDQEERKRTEAYLRKRSKGRRRDLDPDGDEVDALQRYDTVSAYPPLENAASFSSASRAFPQTQHYALEDDPDSADRFSRVEFPLPNRLSPVRLGTSGPLPRRVPGPLTPRRTGRVIVPHPQTIQHESARLEDYCPVPSRPATQLSSYSSNTATLSIIHSSPVQPPLRSTTPLGSPPPLSSYNQAFGTTSARSNWSTQTNAPASTSQSSPRSDAGPKKFASSKQQLTTKEPESEHLDSSLSRLQISRPSDSPPSDPFDTLLDRFERIVAKPCTPPVAPPRAVDWVGPCCATQYQRDQLAHSFIFDRAINEEATTVKAEVEEDAVFVSDRMGLGCKAISKTDAIELVRLELALRGTPLNPEPEEIVDDQKLFESLDWDEADFADHPRDGLLLSSDSRRPPDPLPLPPPPLADPTPPKHVSGTTAMLSNGPWNAPADEDELSSVDDLHLTSSDSGTATLLLVGVTLNDLGDYEDVSARRTLPRYQTAYEPESIRAVGIEGEEERDSIPNEITGVEEVVEIR